MEDSTILGTAVWISRQKNLDKRRELVGDEAEQKQGNVNEYRAMEVVQEPQMQEPGK